MNNGIVLESVQQLLVNIETQLNKFINQIIVTYGLEANEILMKPFQNHSSFMHSAPYCDFTFEYENADLTLLKLCNVYGLFFGFIQEELFVRVLAFEMEEIIEAKLKERSVKGELVWP